MKQKANQPLIHKGSQQTAKTKKQPKQLSENKPYYIIHNGQRINIYDKLKQHIPYKPIIRRSKEVIEKNDILFYI